MPRTTTATPPPAGFSGFPRDLPLFLRDLRENNNKDWFETHRADYEAVLVEPARRFVMAMAETVSSLEPPLNADPRTNRSLRRIHRDTRFSADKRPFNEELHVIFWVGSRPNHGQGVHFVIGPANFAFGAGQWGFEGETLERYRAAVAREKPAAALASAIETAQRQAGTQLDPPVLARPPRGFPASGPHADLLRQKCVIVRSSEPHPDWLFDERLVEAITPRIAAMMPLLGWLSEHLGQG